MDALEWIPTGKIGGKIEGKFQTSTPGAYFKVREARDLAVTAEQARVRGARNRKPRYYVPGR